MGLRKGDMEFGKREKSEKSGRETKRRERDVREMAKLFIFGAFELNPRNFRCFRLALLVIRSGKTVRDSLQVCG